MPIVEIVAIIVIAAIVLAFAIVLVTEVSQRRERKRLESAAVASSPTHAAGRGAETARRYRTI